MILYFLTQIMYREQDDRLYFDYYAGFDNGDEFERILIDRKPYEDKEIYHTSYCEKMDRENYFDQDVYQVINSSSHVEEIVKDRKIIGNTVVNFGIRILVEPNNLHMSKKDYSDRICSEIANILYKVFELKIKELEITSK